MLCVLVDLFCFNVCLFEQIVCICIYNIHWTYYCIQMFKQVRHFAADFGLNKLEALSSCILLVWDSKSIVAISDPVYPLVSMHSAIA